MLQKPALLLSRFLFLWSASFSGVAATSTCPSNYAGVASLIKDYPAAEAYCTAHYPLAPLTVTVTGASQILTVTASSTTTTTITASSTVTAPPVTSTATQVLTTTTTTTSTETDTETDTVTATSTVTATVTQAQKRWVAVPKSSTTTSHKSTTSKKSTTTTTKTTTTTSATQNHQQSAWSSVLAQASSVIGVLCTCIETQSISTKTFTPSITTSVTITATKTATTTASTTLTPTITTTITSISAELETETTTTTTTTTVTTTTTTTNTVTATPNPNLQGPTCNAPSDSGERGAGGCSSSCVCSPRSGSSGLGSCDNQNNIDCTSGCATDSDCPAGSACVNSALLELCGGPQCISYAGCTSTYTPPSSKRDLLSGLVGDLDGGRIGRMRTVPRKRS